MTQTILASVIAGVIMLIIGAVVGRFTVKTKTAGEVEDMGRELQDAEDELHEHIRIAEERNEMILESLLAILLTLKRGNANGEADEALKKLNEYMLHNCSRR
ncbi:MAG: hypothetical protein IJV67_02595 [Clostridia bacterium]|nr:hypothetical protein [Clostridia bacterium]